MNIKKLEIHDFMRIEAMTIDADGRHVSITGPNASGKTSCVDALWWACGGKTAKDLPEPVRQGAGYAFARLDLGDYVVERRVSETGNATLVVTSKDGERIRRPQELIEGLLGRFSLDPVAFIRRKPGEQVSDVLTVMGIEPPVEAIERLTGERYEAEEGETADAYLRRMIGPRVGAFYVKRTELTRRAEEKNTSHQEAAAAMMELGGPPTAADLEADSTELHHQLQAANAEALKYQAKKSDVEAKRNAITFASQQAEALEKAIDTEVGRVQRIEEQINRLKVDLLNANKLVETHRDNLRTKKAELKTLGEAHRDAYNVLEATEDPAAVITELNARITQARDQSLVNERRQHAFEECARLQEESEKAAMEASALDEVIVKIREVQSGLLDGLDLGIEGLAVGDGELRLNGVSFQQASHAEKLKVACAVAMKQNPELKVLRVDDGEHLDTDSRKTVFEMAEAQGWQVFITAVANHKGGIKVEIIDKEAPAPVADSVTEIRLPSKKKKKAA